MKNWGLSIILFISISLNFCKEDLRHPSNSCPIERFEFFILDKNGNPLFTSIDQSVDCDAQNGEKIANECDGYGCTMIRSMEGSYKFYYSTARAPRFSADLGIKDFYIRINGDIDTLFLETTKVQGFDIQCVVIKKAMLNGDTAIARVQTPTGVYTSAFVFKKRS